MAPALPILEGLSLPKTQAHSNPCGHRSPPAFRARRCRRGRRDNRTLHSPPAAARIRPFRRHRGRRPALLWRNWRRSGVYLDGAQDSWKRHVGARNEKQVLMGGACGEFATEGIGSLASAWVEKNWYEKEYQKTHNINLHKNLSTMSTEIPPCITKNSPNPGTEAATAGDKEAARNQGATAAGIIPGAENQQPAGISMGKGTKNKTHGGIQRATEWENETTSWNS
ncbi:hypothetical protein KFK09_001512 [Dendrobium nobile]|uniref:Uncharacterized protein n=1 Tax=Dendrobium nobile TaxID=94219 RepID=A0A8T3C7M5_DENNO|nr:hypothetical protein KFK09_001512 [Dendrobium nobile]